MRKMICFCCLVFIIAYGNAQTPPAVAQTIATIQNEKIKFLNAYKYSNSQTSAAVIPTVAAIQNEKIMFLNAYNFDFGQSSLASNYVGHLNFFSPRLANGRWGFNTGIMKINYGQKDTLNNGTKIKENVFINPFDTIGLGLKYLRQINNYKTEKQNTVWSFYVQPIYELTEPAGDQHIYAHAHLELLASKWSSITTISVLNQDTATFASTSSRPVIRSGLTNTNNYTVNSLSGYFGAGFTFDLRPWNGGSFFFQPTVGFTSNKPSPSSTDINSNLQSAVKTPDDNERRWNTFYLVRAYYTHVLSSSSTVVIGVDIRGLLPLYAPQYAAYVGLNIKLESILNLISN